MRNLRIFAGAEHPHAAQNPEVLDVASMNPKNLLARPSEDKVAAK
jgi:large subunit ribosomal protein L13